MLIIVNLGYCVPRMAVSYFEKPVPEPRRRLRVCGPLETPLLPEKAQLPGGWNVSTSPSLIILGEKLEAGEQEDEAMVTVWVEGGWNRSPVTWKLPRQCEQVAGAGDTDT